MGLFALGVLASLTAAIVFAVGTVIWRRVSGSPNEQPASAHQMEEVSSLLRELASRSAPTGNPPVETSALASATTPDTRQALIQALHLFDQARYRDAIELVLDAYRRDLPADAKIELHHLAGSAFVEIGDQGAAKSQFESALRLSREHGNRYGEAQSLSRLGLVQWLRGELKAARKLLAQALQIFQELDDKKGQADQFRNLGLVAQDMGDFPAALDLHRKALALDESMDNRWSQAWDFGNIGTVLARSGNPSEARSHLENALRMFRTSGNQRGIATQLANLGNLHRLEGHPKKASACFNEAVKIARRTGNALILGNSLVGLGNIAGKPDEARRAYEEALRLFEGIENRVGQGRTLSNLGAVLTAMNRPGDAVPVLQRAVRIQEELGDVQMEGVATYNLGAAYARMGRVGEAEGCFRRAISGFKSIEDAKLSLQEAARLLQNAGKAREAAVVQKEIDRLVKLAHAET